MLRLPIKHIHRAFPELDRYSDEQDDGGTPHPDRARQSFLLTKPVNSAFIGFDYVINDPAR